jgi:hypothetical protein
MLSLLSCSRGFLGGQPFRVAGLLLVLCEDASTASAAVPYYAKAYNAENKEDGSYCDADLGS